MMIRRGLQVLVLVGIAVLGAAPCFSAAYVEGFNPLVNGTYSFYGHDDEFQRLQWVGGDDQDYMFMIQDAGFFLFSGFGNGSVTYQYEDETGRWISTSDGSVLNLNPDQEWTISWEDAGGGYLNGYWPSVPPPPDPFEENFPDWESAAVKIPLGFAFGLAAWASVLGLLIPIKWVREITSAAS